MPFLFEQTLGYSAAGERLTMKLRSNAFTNVLRQDIGWFEDERHTTGKIATRLATDVPMIKSVSYLYFVFFFSIVNHLVNEFLLQFKLYYIKCTQNLKKKKKLNLSSNKKLFMYHINY